jgi:hypothetical protein
LPLAQSGTGGNKHGEERKEEEKERGRNIKSHEEEIEERKEEEMPIKDKSAANNL